MTIYFKKVIVIYINLLDGGSRPEARELVCDTSSREFESHLPHKTTGGVVCYKKF